MVGVARSQAQALLPLAAREQPYPYDTIHMYACQGGLSTNFGNFKVHMFLRSALQFLGNFMSSGL